MLKTEPKMFLSETSVDNVYTRVRHGWDAAERLGELMRYCFEQKRFNARGFRWECRTTKGTRVSRYYLDNVLMFTVVYWAQVRESQLSPEQQQIVRRLF